MHPFLRRLIRRERCRIALWTSAALAVIAAAGCVLLGATAALGAGPGTAVAAVVLVVGIGGWWVVLRAVLAWRRAADPVGQALRVEALRPALRGRLVAMADPPLPGESPALRALLARRTAAELDGVSPRSIHPLIAPLAACSAAWMLAVCTGPLASVSWPEPAEAAVAAKGVGAGPSWFGDLTILYVYPDYTGLEPVVVENGTGDVHGVPGTRIEVSARSRSPVDAAALDVLGERIQGAADGREVHGAFTIGHDAGTWRFVGYAGARELLSRPMGIDVDPDQPPRVWAHGPDVVAEDRPFGLRFTADDDFGISRVALEVDGAEVAELTGTEVTLSPARLGLGAGRSVKLVVAAWDNDAVSGSKVGRSAPLVVRIGEPMPGERRLSSWAVAAVRDEALDALAGTLTDPDELPVPPERFLPLEAWLDQQGGTSDPLELRVVDLVAHVRRLPGADAAEDHDLRRAIRRGLEGVVADADGRLRSRAMARLTEGVAMAHERSVQLEEALRTRHDASAESASIPLQLELGGLYAPLAELQGRPVHRVAAPPIARASLQVEELARVERTEALMLARRLERDLGELADELAVRKVERDAKEDEQRQRIAALARAVRALERDQWAEWDATKRVAFRPDEQAALRERATGLVADAAALDRDVPLPLDEVEAVLERASEEMVPEGQRQAAMWLGMAAELLERMVKECPSCGGRCRSGFT